ncbi:MAG: DUF2953 domain-containing protein [Lachnospiraceae bacterium]|nr:DUF2953 domain-containing protein [Lachnospiraceae bacterium]
MLHAILTILKILLWVILALLGIVLLLILLVLFSPIRYKFDVKYHDNAVIHGKVSFLIASARFFFEQETKTLDYSVRLAGIKLNLGKEKKPKKVKKAKKANKQAVENVNTVLVDDIGEINTDIAVNDNAGISKGQISHVNDSNENLDEIKIEATNDLINGNSIETDILTDTYTDNEEEYDDFSHMEQFDLFDDDIDKDVPKEQQSFIGRLKAFVIGLKDKFNSFKAKLENFNPESIEQKIDSKLGKLKKNIVKFKRFWNLKCTVKTRKYLKKYLIGLVKHIGPRKVKGYIRYGFGDPCKTGQVTGYLSLLPFVYSKHFSLQPDFYEKIIDAEILMKGHIRLGYIIRIVLNINIWRTILVAKKIFKGNRKKEV